APRGTLALTLLIDVGERIDLAQAEARVRSAGREGRRLTLTRGEAQSSIRIPVAPLILDLPDDPGSKASMLPAGWKETLQVAVYDFGVFSCRRILSWPPDMAWSALVS